MTNSVGSLYANVTRIDVHLANAYYPILIDLARNNQLITYGDLVDRAKMIYPENAFVQNAIPVSTGRRLDVVRSFTSSRGLPDITCLVVNESKRKPGDRYPGDPVKAREEVSEYDWSKVTFEFDAFVKAAESDIEKLKLKKITMPKALELMSDYYYKNKSNLPAKDLVIQQRDLILEIIVEGYSPEQAFEQALRNNI